MSTNHNRIKVADLEKNQPDKILKTNQNGELEFSDVNNLKTDGYNALDYTAEGKVLDARQGKVLNETKLTGTIATDAETQITGAVTEDNKVVSRSKLFNWWKKKKQEENKEFTVHNELGNYPYLVEQANLTDDTGSIVIGEYLVGLRSIQMPAEFIYSGKSLFVKSNSNYEVILPHSSGTGNIKFYFFDKIDLKLQRNEIAQFKINNNDLNNIKAEYVAVSDYYRIVKKGFDDTYLKLPVGSDVYKVGVLQNPTKNYTLELPDYFVLPNGISTEKQITIIFTHTISNLTMVVASPATIGYSPKSARAGDVWTFFLTEGTWEVMSEWTGTSLATDSETQIVSAVSEDKKVISRLKLFNWWVWIKS